MQRTAESSSPDSPDTRPAAGRYEPPRYEVISLDCEITAYAPDDRPLF